MGMKLFYPSVGVLIFDSGEENSVGILTAEINSKETSIVVYYPNGTKESFDVKNGTIERYRSGLAGFTTSDGDTYVIKPVEEIDGEWISEYKIPLPVSNLKKTILNSQESTSMPYLQNSGETMLAFQLPEDEYIFGALYINQYGAFMRKNGMWIEVSPLDSTFDGTTSYEIGRDKASQFVDMFDRGALKVSEAEEFLIPQAQEAE
jgi:hypothetical protein